jgi:phosphatidylglycerophosphate synthase
MENILAALNPLPWLSLNPPVMTGWPGRIFLGVFCLLFLAGIVLRMVAGRKKKIDRYAGEMYRRFATLGSTLGALGLVLAFFSLEGIRFLGARFWYLVWLLALVVWSFFAIRYAVKRIPLLRARDREREEKLKYMPGTKI